MQRWSHVAVVTRHKAVLPQTTAQEAAMLYCHVPRTTISCNASTIGTNRIPRSTNRCVKPQGPIVFHVAPTSVSNHRDQSYSTWHQQVCQTTGTNRIPRSIINNCVKPQGPIILYVASTTVSNHRDQSYSMYHQQVCQSVCPVTFDEGSGCWFVMVRKPPSLPSG